MKVCFSSIFGLSMAAFISLGEAPPNLPGDKKVTEQYNLGVRYQLGRACRRILARPQSFTKKRLIKVTSVRL
jgi:hypothetical protein